MNPWPLIGITTYGRDDQGRFHIPANYVDSVRRARGIAVLVPHGESRLDQLLEILDGLILPGGGDLDPDLYGGARHETLYMVDSERDTTEIDLAKQAVGRGLPTLGICRGLQTLNVALGGTLIEHLPDVVGDQVAHRAPPRRPTRHPVTVSKDSRLAEILGQTEIDAASWHHQAIRQVVPALRVVAHAPDGTIEAVEMPTHPWLIGVQWHPELTASEDPIQQRLFNSLVEAAARSRRKRGAHAAQQ